MAEENRKMKHLWMVEEQNGKTFWTKVGIAFENADGSYNMELSAIPVNGRLVMRDPAPELRRQGYGRPSAG